jgi:hypothetical protein
LIEGMIGLGGGESRCVTVRQDTADGVAIVH